MKLISNRSVGVLLSLVAVAQAANAQGPATAANAASQAQISESGYVRLEVTLATTAKDKGITFTRACPTRSLWGIDLKELLKKGSEHVTLGVAITSPGVTTLEFTPVAIDRKREGFLGWSKNCDVMIDEMRYLSPAYYVRRYKNEQFTVAPTFKRTNAASPGLAATIDAAASHALKLAGVPAETAKPYFDQVKMILGQVSVSGNEKFPKHPVILPGPVPSDDQFQWRTTGLLPAQPGGEQVDVVLTARLIPVESLITNPPAGAGGKPVWTISVVLTSPFAANLAAGVNPGGTLGSYVETAAATDLANFRKAATKAEASNGCDPLRSRVRQMGLSDRDEALLMWALTHDRAPTALKAHEVDDLPCLTDAWNYVPAEIAAARAKEPVKIDPKPEPIPLVPPSIKMMKQTTQIDDAFALFLKTSVWAERRRNAALLFAYPAAYADPKGALFDSSASLENVDQWLALHTAATPIAERVGCYTYVPAADAAGKSVMYAIADTIGAGKPAQVLLVATFANSPANGDAKIQALEVSETIAAEQKAKIAAAQGPQCASGYKPALVF
jgi:hypothetical protein